MSDQIVAELSALAHPQRLALFGLLMRRYPDRLPAGEIGQILGAKPSTLSAYLSDLAEAGLIDAERRGTSLLYRARLDAARGMVARFLAESCRGRADPEVAPEPVPGPGAASWRVRNVLFLGWDNGARSLMAEALMRETAGSRFEVFSAGLMAGAQANPQALTMLAELGHDTASLWSKPVTGFLGLDAPRMDLVITLSDRAANVALPVWPGRPVEAHWGLPDPVALGTAEAYAAAYLTLRARVAALAALPMNLPRGALQARLDELARLEADQG